jgi:hypothetical protein
MKHKKAILIILLPAVFAASAAFASDAIKVKVKVQLANVRKTPDLKGAVIQQLPMGTVLNVLEKTGDWYRVALTIGGAPAEGCIHTSVVEEMVEVSIPAPAKPPAGQPAAPPALVPQRPAAPTAPAGKSASKKFFLSAGYQMGFASESQILGYNLSIYQETADFGLDYNLKKGNTIDAALGLFLGKAWGVKFGGGMTSRDFEETTSVSIPHPLWMNSPRKGTITGAGLNISEIDLYLNLFYLLRFGALALELYGGPCYVLSTATIVSNITFAETGYPYMTNTISQAQTEFKANAFGFNAGVSLGYDFGSSFGLFLDARYVMAKATYQPGGDIPDLTATLGGFRAGAGLKAMF